MKWYLISIGIRKYLPMGIMGATSALGAILMAHAGWLEKYGVTYGTWPMHWPAGQDPSGPCVLIEMDTLNSALIGILSAGAAVFLRAAQHHTTGTTKMESKENKNDVS